MAPPDQSDLKTLIRRLAKDGPIKTSPTQRRVRILFNGAFIADTTGTTGALHVWEHPHYPQLYLPLSAFKRPRDFDVVMSAGDGIENDQEEIIGGLLEISVQPVGASKDEEKKTLVDLALFAADLEGKGEELKNFVKIKFDAVDQWFEEDTPIYIHPKDPFKRIDLLSSQRAIRVTIPSSTSKDILLAESPFSIHLYETSLPTRYYMPLTALSSLSILKHSTTTTQCPYKGEAQYYHVVSDGREHRDLVWYYTRPTVECALIAGLCCFYNESVDIWLEENGEWVKQQRPKTHFI